MKFKKKAYGQFLVELYQYGVLFSMNQTDKELRASLEAEKALTSEQIEDLISAIDSHGPNCDAVCCRNEEESVVLIRLRNQIKSPYTLGILNHEVLHATCYILHDRGLHLADASEEAYAYLAGHITQKCLDFAL